MPTASIDNQHPTPSAYFRVHNFGEASYRESADNLIVCAALHLEFWVVRVSITYFGSKDAAKVLSRIILEAHMFSK
jgi:hypothetical protein